MSIALTKQERSTPDSFLAVPPTSSQPSKPQRVLACVRCQQRKVKCNRKFPCTNCIKSQAQCEPAILAPRRRRRRFPERELLERLRKYEDLLCQNNVKFEPLHKDATGQNGSPNMEDGSESDEEQPGTTGQDRVSPSTTINSEKVYATK
jgi:Zn(2)-Cys(6) binuclear cluster domain-containing protein